MITIITWIIVIITLAQFTVALANLVFAERMRIPASRPEELVSILIPARNEERNIGTIISDILAQEHHDFELIICDDQSDDRTAEIVEHYASMDKRVKLIRSEALPDGWLGKNHACHILAEHASGRHYLFLDADVRINGDIIPQVIDHSNKHGLSLISIFPRQVMQSAGEKMSVPVMNYILLSLLPLILVRRSPEPALAAANGQFMFFDAAAYNTLRPHEAHKAHKVEDIAIARYLKAKGMKISCQTGDKRISCRMYNGFREAADGFAKNVIEFFGGSFIMATLFWIITTAGIIPVAATGSGALVVLYISIYLTTRILISVTSRQGIIENLIYLVPQQLSMGFFIFKAILRSSFDKHQWKGRSI